MAKKVFLIAVFVISLLLIGLMLLVADVRNSSLLDGFSTTEEKNATADKDEKVKKQPETFVEKYPEVIQQFNVEANELIQYIQLLKEDFVVGDSFEEMDARKNEILFVDNTNRYAEKGENFVAKIEAYENILVIVHREFPKTKTIASPLRAIKRGEDWLVENYKDFPVISVNASLNTLENAIKRKQKDIITLVVRKK